MTRGNTNIAQVMGRQRIVGVGPVRRWAGVDVRRCGHGRRVGVLVRPVGRADGPRAPARSASCTHAACTRTTPPTAALDTFILTSTSGADARVTASTRSIVPTTVTANARECRVHPPTFMAGGVFREPATVNRQNFSIPEHNAVLFHPGQYGKCGQWSGQRHGRWWWHVNLCQWLSDYIAKKCIL